MTIDVLERMRAANPVPEPEAPAIEPVLARIEAESQNPSTSAESPPPGQSPLRARGLRWRYRMGLVGVLALVAGLALVLTQGSREGLSILARAYAATDSSGSILHYVTSTYYVASSSQTAPHTRDLGRTRVWELDGRVRELTEDASEGIRETVLEPHLFAFWNSSSNRLFRIKGDFHLPLKEGGLGPPAYVPGPFQNPISQLRRWYSEGHLRVVRHEIRAGVRYDVLMATGAQSSGSLQTTRIVIRADDFAPVEVESVISHLGGKFRVRYVTRYSTFRHLIVKASTLALLRLAPHPGAKVQTRTPEPQKHRSTYSQTNSIKQRTVFTSPTGRVECELTPGNSSRAVCQSSSLKARVALGLRGGARVCRGAGCISKMRSRAKRVAFRGTLIVGHHLQCLSGRKAVGVFCVDFANGNSFRISDSSLVRGRGSVGALVPRK